VTQCLTFPRRFLGHNRWLWVFDFFRHHSCCMFPDFDPRPCNPIKLTHFLLSISRFSSQDPSKTRSQRVTQSRNENVACLSVARRVFIQTSTLYPGRCRTTMASPFSLVAARTSSLPHPSSRHSTTPVMSNESIRGRFHIAMRS